MDEIQRIAIEYYRNTVRFSYYGMLGKSYLMLSLPFLMASIYLGVVLRYINFGILPMIAVAIFWNIAREQYNKNLIRHLSFFTHSDSKIPEDHKALYLQVLTGHISDNLHETVVKFDKIVKLSRTQSGFVTDNGWAQFRKFLYDPESKSRIVSLIIYLISLVALIVVVKGNNEINWFDFIEKINWHDLKNFLLSAAIITLLAYVIIVVPIIFLMTYAINPLLLKLSINGALVNYLMAELTRLSFRDTAMQITCASSLPPAAVRLLPP